MFFIWLVLAGVIDPYQCQISGYEDTVSDVDNTVTVTTFDTAGFRITTGGHLLYLKIENECTVTASAYGCTLDAT